MKKHDSSKPFTGFWNSVYPVPEPSEQYKRVI